MLQEKEKGNLEKLLICAHRNPCGEFIFYDSTGSSIKAFYETDYETDKGLELTDSLYEEYIGVAFKNAETGSLFEVSHKCLPKAAFCNGEKVY